jgi:hypothetical protein
LAGVISHREFALYTLGEPYAASAPDPAALAWPVPFSPASYSQYKYGSVIAARSFAHALGTVFIERHPELACAPRLVLTSSPYSYVPTAANTLARWLRPVLNAARARHGLAAAPLVQVDRANPSAGDYGTLSASARDRLMAVNDLSFRRFSPGEVRDAELLIVDDVRVTGAHQRCLARASDGLPLAGRTFLYIASFGTPGSGRVDPTQEDALNHAAIRSLDDLAAIVGAGDFAWNVRVCKFVLDPANRADLPRFLALMPGWFVRDLHRNSCRDGYAGMSRYSPSHVLVRSELARRASPPGRIEPCQIPPG